MEKVLDVDGSKMCSDSDRLVTTLFITLRVWRPTKHRTKSRESHARVVCGPMRPTRRVERVEGARQWQTLDSSDGSLAM